MEDEKKPLTALFRDNSDTREGKYLVKRRDGTVVEWPSFVLGAKDPLAAWALRAYAQAGKDILLDDPEHAKKLGLTITFLERIERLANEFDQYRATHGDGDPGMGRHRKDDPVTIAEMRKGMSA